MRRGQRPRLPKRFWNSMFQNRSCPEIPGDAENLPVEVKFSDGLSGRPVPTDAEVFARHARVGVPYEPFVGSAFTAVGRDHRTRRKSDPCAQRTHHLFTVHCSPFTVH